MNRPRGSSQRTITCVANMGCERAGQDGSHVCPITPAIGQGSVDRRAVHTRSQ
jgi:hypothetical protein